MTSLGTTSVPAIPDSRIARDATDLIRSVESDLVYHHSLRVYSWGALQGALRGLRYDPELLYIGAMFQDIGARRGDRSEHDRFDVDGANAARDFLREHGVSGDALRTVWDAIALQRPRVRAPELLRDHPRLQAQHLIILLRPRPNVNDRAWRSGAREPFSTPPVLDRSFGSMAEQRTTNASGVRVAGEEHSLTVGPKGPTVLQDAYVVQKMQHFNRERVPERVVRQGQRRARLFEVTADVTQWTNAAFLSKVGKRTPVFVRFSTVAGELGSADTVRDPRVPTWLVERGEIARYAYNLHAEDDDFGHAGTLVRDVLDDAERDRMVSNIVGHVSQDVSVDVQGRMIGYWTSVDANPRRARGRRPWLRRGSARGVRHGVDTERTQLVRRRRGARTRGASAPIVPRLAPGADRVLLLRGSPRAAGR
jgi:catalase/catalase-related immune-responsive protein